MSRPHGGLRALFPFENPLRGIFPKGSRLPSKLYLLLNSFELNLADKIRKLRPEDLSDIFSLCWTLQAIRTLQEVHNNVKDLIGEFFPVSDWDENWIDIYLDSSVKLLDICIALSSELSQLDQGQLLLKYVLHILENPSSSHSSEQMMKAHASLHDWRRKISLKNPKLENCLVLLESLQGSLCFPKVKNSAKGKVLMKALYGVKAITVFLCSIVVASLSGCCKPLIDLHLHVSDEYLWFEAFRDFQAVVSEEIRRHSFSRKATILKQIEAVQVCVSNLQSLTSIKCGDCCTEEPLRQGNNTNHHEEIMTQFKSSDFEEEPLLKECITSLADRAVKLGQEIDSVTKQVDEFFRVVLIGRDALLCNFVLPQDNYRSHIDRRA